MFRLTVTRSSVPRNSGSLQGCYTEGTSEQEASLFFVGSAREDLASFPDAARRAAGYELFMVQAGRQTADFKPLPDVGPGAHEMRVRDDSGAFRVIYVAKFKDAVYVLHAFQKKTRKTSPIDIELAERRYRMIGVKP